MRAPRAALEQATPPPLTNLRCRRANWAHYCRSLRCLPWKIMTMAKILIGTSGWHYASWRGPFYPPTLRQKDWLRFYVTQFPTTELNGVFYRTPTPQAVKDWCDQTPDDFVFAWNASKFITHWKRLSERSANSLDLLESRTHYWGTRQVRSCFNCRLSSKSTTTGWQRF